MRIPKALFVVLVGVLSLALGATAGSLTPSALPAATMHSLANIYDSIASAAFDSSAITANQNGSLLANLKYIENQIVWASGSTDIWNLNSGNVGIGTTTPVQKLDVAGSVNVSKGSYYRYNNVIFAMASTSLDNYFTGGAGNLTMTGTENTAVGYQALSVNTTGNSNTANGFQALLNNTTGNENTAVGTFALYSNTTGNENTAVGFMALDVNTTGVKNTAVGYQALDDNTTGSNNTALGYNTGRGITTGSNNTILGANVTGLAAGLSNTVILADGAGNQRLYINSTGNVGIGTTAPTATLHIVGDTPILLDVASGSNSRFAVLENGNIGIGTTTPTTMLDVIGAASVSTNFEVRTGYASLSNTLWVSPPGYAGNVGVGTRISTWNTVPSKVSILGSKDLTSAIGNQLTIVDDTAITTGTGGGLMFAGKYTTAGDYAFSGGIDTYKSNGTSGNFSFDLRFFSRLTGGGSLAERMRILSTGLIGMNTATPLSNLGIKVSGTSNGVITTQAGLGVNAITLQGVANVFDSKAGYIASWNDDSVGRASGMVLGRYGSNWGTYVAFNTHPDDQATMDAFTEKMRIDGAGNVGIGTTTPTTTLDVIGAASISTNFEVRTGYASLSNTLWVSPPGYAGNVGIGVTSPNTGFVLNRSSLEIQSSHDAISSPTSWANIGADEGLFLSYDSANHNGRIISIQSGSQLRDLFLGGASISFSTGTGGGTINERMRISGAGNVGIGVGFSSIEALLEVGGTASISGLTNIYNSVSAYGASETITGPTSVATAGAGGVQILYDRTNNKGVLRSILSGVTMEPLYFQANEFRWATGAGSLLEKMVLTLAGNLGIGSIAPEQKLEVAGNILASASAASVGLTLNNLSEDDAKFTIQSTGTAGSIARLDVLGSASQTFMSIASSGNVGINTITPVQKLQVAGDIRVGTGTTGCVEDADGTVISGTCSSDERLKKDITPLTNILSRLSRLQPTTYRWRSDEFPERHWGAQVQLGLIAQQVAPSMPELIATASDGFLQVRYNDLPLYLLSGIRELASRAFQLDELLAPRDSHLEPSSSALARLVHNILAYVAEVFGITIEQGRVRTPELCLDDVCVTRDQLHRLLEVNMLSPVTPTPVPVVSVDVAPIPMASDSAALTPTPTSSPPNIPTDTPASPPSPTPTAEFSLPSATP